MVLFQSPTQGLWKIKKQESFYEGQNPYLGRALNNENNNSQRSALPWLEKVVVLGSIVLPPVGHGFDGNADLSAGPAPSAGTSTAQRGSALRAAGTALQPAEGCSLLSEPPLPSTELPLS